MATSSITKEFFVKDDTAFEKSTCPCPLAGGSAWIRQYRYARKGPLRLRFHFPYRSAGTLKRNFRS